MRIHSRDRFLFSTVMRYYTFTIIGSAFIVYCAAYFYLAERNRVYG